MANTQISISRNGKTTLATAGKYCERNIDINVAVASAENDIPAYVKSEADSLASKVVSAQGNSVFTLAAITDLHYGNGSYTDGILHASQALAYINKQIALDAFAVLGDYTDGYPIDDVDNAFSDCRKVNSLLSPIESVPNMRMQGNHDFYSGYAQFVHYNIQAYSEGVTWGDRIGGYFYRDFADKKLRIICVNTTETDNVRLTVSDAQYKWFIGALDLSAKTDASDWQILILSHHPLDWYATTYVFGYIVNAYNSGGSWSGGNISCNFSGKNSAKLIGNIHGHIHNLLVDKIHMENVVHGNRTDVTRIATPEACIGRANQYNYDGWDEAITYNKVKNSADDTSFVVYCIDLNNQNIKAFCYGAGYDREISYAPVAPTAYNITNILTNCTASGADTIVEEGMATITISVNNGYELPDTIVVNGASYTWDKFSGTVVLSNPVSDVAITVIATEIELPYTNLIPLSINADGTLYNGGKGWKTGYRLNSSGAEAAATGMEVVGFIPFKLGDVAYFANIGLIVGNNAAQANNQYIAFYDASFAKIANTRFSDAMLQSASTTYIADASGNLKSLALDYGIFNFMGLGNQSGNARYFRISAEEIDDDSVITLNEPIDISPTVYSITNNLTNCTSSGVNTIVEGGSATITISANSGYELPDTITISGANYVWDKSTGTVTLSNPTSDITVTVAALVAKPKYTNQIPLSINADGSQFVGTNGEDGYKSGYRLNSSGTETTTTSATNAVTGYIKCTSSSVVRFKNMPMNYNSSNGAYVVFYDSSFSKIISQKIQDGVQNGDKGMTFDSSGNLTQVHDPAQFAYAYGAGGSKDKIAYIRVSADSITSSSIVTVDEEIV